MITVKFHKALLPYTNGAKEIRLERDTYFHTFRNCINLFPTLENLTKQLGTSNLQDMAIVIKGKVISYEELFFLPPEDSILFIVPSFYGGEPLTIAFAALAFLSSTVMSLAQGYDLGTALLRGVIGAGFTLLGIGIAGALSGSIIGQAVISAAVTALGSVIINSISGPPPVARSDAADAGARRENDIFSSLINTTGEGAIIPLNYGMIRLGGHYISTDIETITLQKSADQTDDTNILEDQNTNQGASGAMAGVDYAVADPGWTPSTTRTDITWGPLEDESKNRNTDREGSSISPNTSTTDYQGQSLTPDQYSA